MGDQKKPDASKATEEKKSFEGNIVQDFIYKKKRYHKDTTFKTEDKKLFSQLLTTKRIVE